MASSVGHQDHTCMPLEAIGVAPLEEHAAEGPQEGFCMSIKKSLEVPLTQLVHELMPSAEDIQQDVDRLLHSMAAASQAAQDEKDAIDKELRRLTQVLQRFQENMAKVMGGYLAHQL